MDRNIDLTTLTKYLPLIIYRECERQDNLNLTLDSGTLAGACRNEGLKVMVGMADSAHVIDPNNEFIDTVNLGNNGVGYRLTVPAGFHKARELENEVYGTSKTIEPALVDVLQVEIVAGGIPAADRIVTLDHNSKEHKTTLTKLDEVIEEIGNPNGKDELRALAYLKAARELLQAPELDEEDRGTLRRLLDFCKQHYPKVDEVITLLVKLKILAEL